MKISVVLLLALVCLFSISPAVAGDKSGLIEVSPFVGVNIFDRDFDGNAGLALGARGGYHFTDEWEAELELLYGFFNRTDEEMRLMGVGGDALYHAGFLSFGKVSPYLSLGAGSVIYDYDNVKKTGFEREWAIRLGTGAEYPLTDRMSLRADLRLIETYEPPRENLLATIGFSWYFDAPKSAAPEAIPAPATSAAPSPVAPTVVAEPPKPAVESVVAQTPPPGPKAEPSPVAKPEPEVVAQTPVAEPQVKPKAIAETSKPVAPAVVPPAHSPKAERREFPVQFALDSHKVTKSQREEVEKLAQLLLANPKARVTIEGHTDSTGDASYNQTLSEKRAQSLASILIKEYKISPERITTVGFSEDRPAAPNNTREGRAKNRRAVAVVTE